MAAARGVTSHCNRPDTSDLPQSGQAAVFLIAVLGIFLLAVFGFAVDLTNIWFHRQTAVAAADAACQAGAQDMLASSSGLALPGTGFIPGTSSDCVSSPLATMCSYAAANSYNGTGLVAGAASNAISWTFPPTVTGVVPGLGTYPFMQVLIAENVKTYFISLLNASHVQRLNVSSTCGVTLTKGSIPMLVLNPTLLGAFNYSLAGQLNIVGGPQRALQVNSTSPLAVSWLLGMINLSAAGPNQTGGDVGIVGGPATAPGLPAGSGFQGGTTGSWKGNVLPVADPFAAIGAPTSILSITPPSLTGTWVAYGVDGCPNHLGQLLAPTHSCLEYGPGYYPLGIDLSLVLSTTAIFKPGIYYLGGPLNSGLTNTLRVAKPSGYLQTDGVMMYFAGLSSLNLSSVPASGVDSVAATDLTCDGSSPPAGLGLGTTISGNVLYGQCAANGTYFDSGGDTSDVRSATGSRGVLLFQSHSVASSPALSGVGPNAFAGTLYFHSSSYLDVLSVTGSNNSVFGEVVSDQVSLLGGSLTLAPSPTTNMTLSKISIFN
ncbi:pilus assembly protein TadG-related protein [Granulicella sibirica]|uniref:pilus assembly protein TadG-related protein n=1 Tax=Granulicella sibirica TaxID=2479048 RepID=UPI001375CBE9|nr:pilus assembly protein TadG-related protein [Granulicella sibirica]